MIDTDREDLRLLIIEFNDGPMGCADDFAWRRHLKTYEGLLAEVKELRERVATLESLMEYMADEEKVIE